MYGSTSKAGGLLAAALLAALVLAGCSKSGGDDAATTEVEATSPSTTAAETTTTEAEEETTTTEASPDVDIPTYEDAKRVYMAQTDEATKASCAEDEEDKELNMSSGSYVKFICSGIVRFEYIEGAENYESEWPAISNEAEYHSVFSVPDALIVVPVGSNNVFAQALADDCGCGEVLEQTG